MSYANPEIYLSDPLAFQRGFDTSFKRDSEYYEKQKAERERLKAEKDRIMSVGYNAASMKPLANVEQSLQEGLQKSLNSVIEDGDFSKASRADQEKMVQEVGLLKNTFGILEKIALIDPEKWDVRNDPKISKLKAILDTGEGGVEIIGKGRNMIFRTDDGDVTLDDISGARIMDTSPLEEAYDKLEDEYEEQAKTMKESAAKAGKSQEEVDKELMTWWKSKLRAAGPGMAAYLYSNRASDSVYERNGSFIYGDPEQTKKMSTEDREKFYSDQFNSMAEDMFFQTFPGIIDPTKYLNVTPVKTSGSGRAAATPKPTKLTKDEREQIRYSRELADLKGKLNEATFAIPKSERPGSFPAQHAYEYQEEIIDLSNPDTQNKLTELGFTVQQPLQKDFRGNIIGTVVYEFAPGRRKTFNINTTGLTEEQFKEQLMRIAGSDYVEDQPQSFTESGAPIITQ